MSIKLATVRCRFKEPCFARSGGEYLPFCEILSKQIETKTCPFCKPERDVTDGIKYPYNPIYGRNASDVVED